jgi:Type IV secretion system pilin
MDWGSCVQNGVATLQCIPIVFKNIVFWLFALAGIAAVFFVMFAGVKFLTSGGDPKQVEGARKTMTYAIIGLVVILLSFAIVNLIAVVTGTTCITAFGFSNCH